MVNLRDIENAREEIKDVIHQTPLLESELLNAQADRRIFLKAEHLQKTGSFKIRGAVNAVKQAVQKGAKSITAASSGNHGQAVAYIAGRLGIPAVIVVPEDANRAKVAAIEAYGGQVEYCGFTSADRIPRAQRLAKEKEGVYIPPYDHPHIIAGQGTVGLEIMEQIPDVDVIVVPVGGGGLISGILTAVKESKPEVEIIGVEPESGNDTFLSLESGKITGVSNSQSIADGLRTSQPGELTFPILQKYIDGIVVVTEEEIKYAMQFFIERTKQLIEPSAATAVAAVLTGKAGRENQKIAVVLSGGNIDLTQLQNCLPG
ncbi:threonine/serine dehydratase [Planomicrobium okeanokoites]|uniref:threonine ammonia-lyase n=1 Tax=Planomicrobium okeanokoites TaxID=244 RepID=UPI0030F59270